MPWNIQFCDQNGDPFGDSDESDYNGSNSPVPLTEVPMITQECMTTNTTNDASFLDADNRFGFPCPD